MAKIVISLFSTADGVVEAPDKFMRHWDDEMAADLQDQLSTWEGSLLGRRQYDDWAAYWPDYPGGEDAAFADKINSISKYVITSSALEPQWSGAQVLGEPDAPLADRVAPLRSADGDGDIMVGGSISLANSLIKEGLADEIRLLVTPYVFGSGRKLFDGVTDTALELVSAKATSTGSLLVRYRATTSTSNP